MALVIFPDSVANPSCMAAKRAVKGPSPLEGESPILAPFPTTFDFNVHGRAFTSRAISAFLFLSRCFLHQTGIHVVVRHSSVLWSKLLLKMFTRNKKNTVRSEGGNTLSSHRRDTISCKPQYGDGIELYCCYISFQ